jgi:RHS repeat-associated protein
VLTKNATSGGGTLSYAYDADGNLVKSTDAGGSTTYTYDNRDLLSSLTDESGKLWQFTYNADKLRTNTWFATNSGNTSWAEEQVTSYDKADRITRIQAYRASSTSNVVSDVSYCYSAYVSGQSCPTASASTDRAILQYSVNNQTGTVSQYTYDAGNRLTAATNFGGGNNYSYTYDTDGNVLTGSNKGTETYNAANQSTVSGYTYDGAGNLTATPGNGTSTYNDAEQWTGASNAGGNGAESFTYAGSGQNEVLSDGSATGITYGLADQNSQPWIQSYTPAGSSTDYVIRDQRGTPLGYVQSGSSYAFTTDNIGSVTNVVASCGCVEATYTYDPYGHQNSATGTDAAQNLIRYTGALYDTASNYWHLGARWQNPTTAFFTTQDSNSYLDNPSDGNRYAYASDSPINYTDPTGHDSCSALDLMSIGAAVVGFGLLMATVAVPALAAAPAIIGAGIFSGEFSLATGIAGYLCG